MSESLWELRALTKRVGASRERAGEVHELPRGGRAHQRRRDGGDPPPGLEEEEGRGEAEREEEELQPELPVGESWGPSGGGDSVRGRTSEARREETQEQERNLEARREETGEEDRFFEGREEAQEQEHERQDKKGRDEVRRRREEEVERREAPKGGGTRTMRGRPGGLREGGAGTSKGKGGVADKGRIA